MARNRILEVLKVFVLPLVLYVVAARLGALYGISVNNASLVWPAAGIAAYYAFRFGAKTWIPLFLGGVIGNWLNGYEGGLALALGAETVVEAVVFTALIRFFRRDLFTIRIRSARLYLASLGAGLLGAVLGVASLVAFGAAEAGSALRIASTWAWGDAVGIFLVVKLVLSLPELSHRTRHRIARALFFVGVSGVGMAFFALPPLFPYFALVFLLNIAIFQFAGRLYSYVFPVVLLLTSVYFQLQNVGPFVSLPHDAEFEYKLFFLTLLVSTDLYDFLVGRQVSRRISFLLGVAWSLSVLTYFGLYGFENDRESERIRIEVSRLVGTIQGRFVDYEDALRAGVAFAAGRSQTVTDEQWATFVQNYRLLERYPGINGMGLIFDVKDDAALAWAEQRRALNPTRPFVVHAVPEAPGNQPRLDGSQRFIITLIEPFETNQAARGLDIATEQSRAEGALRARRDQKLALTSRITLVQDQRQGPGFLLFMPIVSGGQFEGWVYSPLIARNLFSELLDGKTGEFDVHVLFGDSRLPEDLLYESTSGPHGPNPEQRTVFSVGGQRFTLEWRVDYSRATHQLPFAMLFGCVAMVISFLIGGLFRNLENTGVRARRLAESMTRELNAVNVDLKSAYAAKSAFLANMSHEIRTPINGIVGLISLLDTSELSSEQKLWLQGIKSSSEGLIVIINDILEISKIEAGKLVLAHEVFNLKAILDEMALVMPMSCKGKDVTFSVEHSLTGSEWFRGDRHRLKQVLSNLCSNAVKFTLQGTVVLGLTRRESGEWEFWVTDTGIGIEAEVIPRLFEPFVQADSSTSRNFGGSGLGLSISRRLVTLMGGTMAVQSVLGEGSRFSFVVALEAAEVPTEKRQSPGFARVHRRSLAILVAEDVALNQMVVRKLLEKMGHSVTLATDGRQAFELVTAGKFDLILMDCQMPEVDGFQATRNIRDWERNTGRSRHPILALTANVLAEAVAECLEAGMDGFLAKPIDAEALFQTIDARLMNPPTAATS